LNDKDAQLSAKDKKIADLQNALDECQKKPKKAATATNLQPTVLFRQGKSSIDKAQYAPIELIASYMKNHPEANVEIKGYASPEGNAEFNQKLSQARAEAVKNALVKKYKISADRLKATGCGVTDKLFEQVEFNRVATFNDTTKD
jgi:outer membrane protein OmpA-like peptidoglycan-associated protein